MKPYRFLLRMPDSLRARLVQAAAESGRSLNAELVYRLERSLPPTRLERRRRTARAAVRTVALAAAAAAVAAGAAAVGWETTSLALEARAQLAARGPKPPALVAPARNTTP